MLGFCTECDEPVVKGNYLKLSDVWNLYVSVSVGAVPCYVGLFSH